MPSIISLLAWSYLFWFVRFRPTLWSSFAPWSTFIIIFFIVASYTWYMHISRILCLPYFGCEWRQICFQLSVSSPSCLQSWMYIYQILLNICTYPCMIILRSIRKVWFFLVQMIFLPNPWLIKCFCKIRKRLNL